MRKRIPKEIRDEVLAKSRAGEKVVALAEQYGISSKTIYGWLSKDSGEDVVSVLKYNKVKRENQELKRLLGEVTLEMSLGKKISLVQAGELKSVRAIALGIERKNIYRSSKLVAKDKALAEKIKAVHKTDPAYGHRRVAWELGINPKRALRVMNKFGIKPPRRKAKKYWCTISTDKHSYTNLIKEIIPQIPHQIWASDVSYIKFQGRFWYLSTIEDLTTRQIMAAQVGKHHDAKLVKTTINQALKTGIKPTYFHTDQGY